MPNHLHPAFLNRITCFLAYYNTCQNTPLLVCMFAFSSTSFWLLKRFSYILICKIGLVSSINGDERAGHTIQQEQQYTLKEGTHNSHPIFPISHTKSTFHSRILHLSSILFRVGWKMASKQ